MAFVISTPGTIGITEAIIIVARSGYLVVEILDRRLHAQFIPEFLGSLVIGIISVLGHYLLPTGF
jgi:uncharacterized membrane protein YjjP (DUF1212 family)